MLEGKKIKLLAGAELTLILEVIRKSPRYFFTGVGGNSEHTLNR